MAVAATPPPLERASAVVDAWNAALNRHDADALAAVYAPEVNFYGQRTPRASIVATKRKALAATPTFVQKLDSVRIVPDGDGFSVTFDKTSGAADLPKRVQARLRIESVADVYAIAVESDVVSDARSDVARTCSDVAHDVVMHLPAVERVFKEAPADARTGGVTYEERADAVSAAIGFHHDDRFESVFQFSVENGKLNVTGYDDVTVPAKDQARIRAKCRP